MWRQSERAANAQVDALARLLDGGRIRLYTGRQPDTLAHLQDDLLADLPLASPAFVPASGGAAVVLPSGAEVFAAASGAPGWFLLLDSAGTPVASGEIGSEMTLDRALVEAGAHLLVAGFALRAAHV